MIIVCDLLIRNIRRLAKFRDSYRSETFLLYFTTNDLNMPFHFQFSCRSEKLVRRCAREVFGALRIVVDFFLIFLLEFLRFLAYNIIGLFLVGLLTTFGDYLFKPVLAALFNSILQPVAVFLYNGGVALQTVFNPLIDILRGVFTQIAMLLRALRLVEINWKRGPEQNTLRSMEEV